MEMISLCSENEDAQKVAEEQAASIRKMSADRDQKIEGAMDNFLTQLDVVADKYLTANGIMAALETVRDVLGEHNSIDFITEFTYAQNIAQRISRTARTMRESAEETKPENMAFLCDSFFDHNFTIEEEPSVSDVAFELMRLQLCQNVGPNASDITNFFINANAEIETAQANLIEYCNAHDIDYESCCNQSNE